MNPPYEILIPDNTRTLLAEYEVALRSGNTQPGARLATTLNGDHDFLTALLSTKQPLIFAESAVAGDGSDWNLTELGLLGDISVAMVSPCSTTAATPAPRFTRSHSTVASSSFPVLCCEAVGPASRRIGTKW